MYFLSYKNDQHNINQIANFHIKDEYLKTKQKIEKIDLKKNGEIYLSYIDNNKSNKFNLKISKSANSILIFYGLITNFNEIKTSFPEIEILNEENFLRKIIETYGIGYCLPYIEGYFSILFINLKINKIYFSTDKFNTVKNYFYEISKNGFVASNEISLITSFLEEDDFSINKESKDDFNLYGYINHPKTIYQKIFSLPLREIYEYDISNKRFSSFSLSKLSNGMQSLDLKKILLKNLSDLLNKFPNSYLILDLNIGSLALLLMAKYELGINLKTILPYFENDALNNSYLLNLYDKEFKTIKTKINFDFQELFLGESGKYDFKANQPIASLNHFINILMNEKLLNFGVEYLINPIGYSQYLWSDLRYYKSIDLIKDNYKNSKAGREYLKNSTVNHPLNVIDSNSRLNLFTNNLDIKRKKIGPISSKTLMMHDREKGLNSNLLFSSACCFDQSIVNIFPFLNSNLEEWSNYNFSGLNHLKSLESKTPLFEIINNYGYDINKFIFKETLEDRLVYEFNHNKKSIKSLEIFLNKTDNIKLKSRKNKVLKFLEKESLISKRILEDLLREIVWNLFFD